MNEISEPQCPECEKLHSVEDESQKIGFFLEWLFSTGRVLCSWEESKHYDEDENLTTIWNDTQTTILQGYYPTRDKIENLLAEYFKIDLNKVEEERRAILEYVRSWH